MGTYGISAEEFLEGVQKAHIKEGKETELVGFEQFLRAFEGDISARTVAEAWNELAKRHGWTDVLQWKEVDKK
jgi:hypothetical protein